MKSLDEYRKEIEKDPKARRKLRKLEEEFHEVEESLTEEELIKYGLKPSGDDEDLSGGAGQSDKKTAADDSAADSVLDSIARKI